ncbi:MAG: RDD family protein [Bacilli bacterium]|nr:RDD family protein [Bacilli bacterium]
MSEEVIKKDKKKALFLQRLVAFILDAILVSTLSSLIATPFVDTDKITRLEKQTREVFEKYKEKDTPVEEFISEYYHVYYQMSRSSGIITLIDIFVAVLYFVVYQTCMNGQTIGKKLMKIRVVPDSGELSYNQMIFRSFISNSILIDIILFIFMLFAEKDLFFYVSVIFEGLQYIIILLSVFMIMNSKDGCAIHDRIVHTKVLREV